MRVLGIDTATPTGSVALVEDGEFGVEEVFPSAVAAVGLGAEKPNHAVELLSRIDALLCRAGITLAEVSALGVSLGPGSFTGLRIGLSTVKGMAYGWQIPVAGVPTLPAMATRVGDWNGLICPFVDARKKEVYAALFRRSAGSLDRLTEDQVGSPGAFIRHVRVLQEPCLFIGSGVEVYGALIRDALGGAAFLPPSEAYPSAAFAVALLAEQRVRRRESDALGELAPVYLRPAEAELGLQARAAGRVRLR